MRLEGGPIAFALEGKLWGQLPEDLPEVSKACAEAAKTAAVAFPEPRARGGSAGRGMPDWTTVRSNKATFTIVP